ncbi:hypothetical protein Pint_07277 [Pistacia integerrima]|uniref:Uncharacterized protein n=1 Tax=Pistacia integerrima TaxID=434235 RepID=A0ACC0XUL0_9ROSI|nr:hypothetical protein Pint_07277 [Pistacia integerrima]
MEILLKKLYVRRMAADLGIIRIYASGKMVGTETNMNKRVFKLMTDSMTSDIYRNSLVFDRDQIKAELLLELPKEQLLNWIFQCLGCVDAMLSAPFFFKEKEKGFTLRRLQIGNDKCDTTSLAKLGYASSFWCYSSF